MLNENLWNQSARLSPKYRKFSADHHFFKQSVQNFSKAETDERVEKFQNNVQNLLIARQSSNDRQNARKLERLIV